MRMRAAGLWAGLVMTSALPAWAEEPAAAAQPAPPATEGQAAPAPTARDAAPAVVTQPTGAPEAQENHPTPSIGVQVPGPVVRVEGTQPVTGIARALPPAQQQAAPAPVEQTGFHSELHGFVRGGYSFVQRDPQTFSVGQNSGFRLYNTRVELLGGYGDRVGFDLSLDTDQRLDGATNLAALQPALRDANLSFHQGAFTLTAGQFKAPFNGEFLLPDAEVPFARRSLVSEGLPGDEGRLPYASLGLDRQIGAMLSAKVPAGSASFDFQLAAVNGNGLNQGRNDNRRLAYAGRAALSVAGSVVSLSGFLNDRTVGRLSNLQDERDLGLDVDALVKLPLDVRLFGMFALQRTQFVTASGQQPQTSYGTVGSLARTWELNGMRVEPAARFALYSPTDLVPEAALIDVTGGVNLYPSSLPARLQLNYTRRIERKARQADNDLLEAVLQANF